MSSVFTALRTQSKEDCLSKATSVPARRMACERKDLRLRDGLRGCEGVARPKPEMCDGDSYERDQGCRLYEWGGRMKWGLGGRTRGFF